MVSMLPSPPERQPLIDTSHMLPEHFQPKKTGAGPTAGIIIIVILLIFGALYFWGAALNENEVEPLPLIPGTSDSLN